MLSRKAKYALKALLYIHQNPDQLPISTKSIAEAQKIPYKFLETIMNDLKQHRIIKSQRGAKGGYSFVKTPEEITVANIMRIVDGPIALTTCTSENFYERCEECMNEEHCQIKQLFSKVRTQMLPLLNTPISEL